MASFICPVCGKDLFISENSFKCSMNHCYDISRSGYINLLQSQKAHNHGDDKLMVRARKEFLDSGHYNRLRDAVSSDVVKYCRSGDTVLDAGCGECFYTSDFTDKLAENGINADVIGIDISKNALAYAKSRNSRIKRAVASVFHLPVADKSCRILLSVFAPYCEQEFLRVISDGGYFIQVIPLENHLWSLKKAVYDNPYKNNTDEYSLNGFELIKSREIRYTINLKSNSEIKNLFMMTPYYYKTSEMDFRKLDTINELAAEAEFAVLVYRKK